MGVICEKQTEHGCATKQENLIKEKNIMLSEKRKQHDPYQSSELSLLQVKGQLPFPSSHLVPNPQADKQQIAWSLNFQFARNFPDKDSSFLFLSGGAGRNSKHQV